MPTPTAFKVTVTELYYDPAQSVEDVKNPDRTIVAHDVFVQSFPFADFDLPTIVLALNKKRRIRKSKKESAA